MRKSHRYLAAGFLSTALMSVGPALARADDGSIIIDFVRHGESIDNAAGISKARPDAMPSTVPSLRPPRGVYADNDPTAMTRAP